MYSLRLDQSPTPLLVAVLFMSALGLACGPIDLVRELLAPSGVWYVAIGGDDSSSCRSETEACATIEAAVDKASDNGEIRILAGRYITSRVHIDKNLRVIGAGSGSTYVEGLGGTPVFFLGSEPFDDLPAPPGGAAIFLSGMTLERGWDGVLWNDGVSSVLSDLRVRNTGGMNNGAFRNFADSHLNMLDVHVEGLTVTARSGCSAIENAGTMDLREFTITGGSGGRAAICNTGTGTLTITHGEIAGNGSSGLWVGEHATTRVSSTVFSENGTHQGGGAIYNRGTLSLTTSTLRNNRTPDNFGGGIFNAGEMSIIRSTISGNEALEAGGIFNQELASASLVHTTISSNRALDGYAGGIYTLGAMQIDFTTVAFNDPIGVLVDVDHPSPAAQRSIFASNLTDDCAVQITVFTPEVAVLDEIIHSLGHNLDSDNRCGLGGPGDLTGVDPRLGPLTDNGGVVLTHALESGSPAIDTAGDCETMDARNVTRPQGAACDMGAYEVDLTRPEGTRLPASGQDYGMPGGPVTCRTGPGSVYPPLTYFDAGDELRLQARSSNGDWLQVGADNQPPCWVFRDLLDVDPAFDIFGLPVVLIPPTPTWTPPPPTQKPGPGPQGCWHQGPNDNQPLCYVTCPPNPNPGGACTP